MPVVLLQHFPGVWTMQYELGESSSLSIFYVYNIGCKLKVWWRPSVFSTFPPSLWKLFLWSVFVWVGMASFFPTFFEVLLSDGSSGVCFMVVFLMGVVLGFRRTACSYK